MSWVVTPLTPYDGQINLNPFTRFTWSKFWEGGGIQTPEPSSWIWIADDALFTINVQKIEVPTATFYDLTTALDKDTGYYWGIGINDTDEPTPVFKFTTGIYPDKVTLLTPLDEATGQSTRPTLTWSAAADADTYNVQITITTHSGSQIVYQKNGISGTSHEIETILSNNQLYSWNVWGVNDNGNVGPASDTWTFTTDVADPVGDPTLIYPLNTDSDVPLAPLFDWTDVQGTTTFNFELYSDAGMTQLVDSRSTTVSQYQLPFSLDYATQYWWRVRAVDSSGPGNWVSDNFTTKDEPTLTAVPVISYPTEGQVDFEVPGTIQFYVLSAESPLMTFRIQITLQTDTGWASLFDEAVLPSTQNSYLVYQPTMEYETEYMVRIRVETPTQTGDWSTIVNFTTEAAGFPAIPEIYIPEDGADDVSTNPTIQWTSVQFADSYNLQIATDVNFSNIVANPTGLPTSEYIASLEANTEYWIRVRAWSDSGSAYTHFSSVVHFTTAIVDFPSIPILISPYNQEYNVDRQPMFIWGSANNATSYQIQVSTSGDFSTNVINMVGVEDTFLATTVLLDYEKLYYWRVRGENVNGSGEWSTVWSFTVRPENVIKAPVLFAPYLYQGEVSRYTTFEWRQPKDSQPPDPQTSWGFEISVATDELFTEVVYGATSIQEETITLTTPLDYNTKYYWRVRMRIGSDYGPWAEPWNFKTEQVTMPSRPVIYLPVYGDTVSNRPTIKWYIPSDRDAGGGDISVNHYNLQLSKTSTFESIVYEKNEVSLEHLVTRDLEYETYYYVRVRAHNNSGYGDWSDYSVFLVEAYSGPTPDIMDLQIQMQFDVLNKRTILTDLIGLGGSYTGVTVDELRGLFRLTGPNGIIYENPGFDTDDFSSPDTTGESGSESWVSDSIALPTDSAGNLATGEYTVEYKLREDSGGAVITTNTTTFIWLYTGLTPVINYSLEIAKSRMIVTDNTVYDINLFNSKLTQENDLDAGSRTWVVRYPIGAGYISTTRHQQQILVGPNLWTGNYDISLVSTVQYTHDYDSFLRIKILDTMYGKEDKVYVSQMGCMSSVLSCLEVLTSKFEFAKTNNLNTRDALKNMIDQIMAYYNMYQIALLTGGDTVYPCEKLRTLLAQADCACAEEDNNASMEILPVIPVGGGGSADGGKYEFVATQNQQTFDLPTGVVLTANDAIYVNGNLLASTDYTGVGTGTLTLDTPADRYDVVVVLKYV